MNQLGFKVLTGIGTDSYSSLCPPWYGELKLSSETNDNVLMTIETLAIKLLAAELLMRACERQVSESDTFDGKMHSVKMMLPYLLEYASSLDKCHIPPPFCKLLSKLRVRIEWLGAIFFVSWSKSTQTLRDEKEAEKLALEHIDNALSLLKTLGSDIVIKTPQLESPGRSGNHWVELPYRTLSAYRDELESSTLISDSRQRFFELLSTWKKNGFTSTADISEEDQSCLQTIGIKLFQRYQLGNAETSIGKNTDELIDEFITMYSPLDSTQTVEDNSNIVPNQWPNLWHLIPIDQEPVPFENISNPSIITLLSLTLLYKKNYKIFVASFLGNLIGTVAKKCMFAFNQMEASRSIGNNSSSIKHDSSSDDDSSIDNVRQKRGLNPLNAQELSQMIHFLASKLWSLLQDATSNALQGITKAVDIVGLIQLSIEISSAHSPQSKKNPEKSKIRISQNIDLLKSSLAFASTMINTLSSEQSQRNVISAIFASLCLILVRERDVMPYLSLKGNHHFGRSERLRLSLARSQFISVVAAEVAALLSNHQSTNIEILVEESFLIKDLVTLQSHDSGDQNCTLVPLAKLAESLAWFWNFLPNLDSRVIGYLRVPIAAAIISLIGSSGYSKSSTIMKTFSQLEIQSSKELSSLFSLSDYFESDDSAKGCLDKDENEGNTNQSRRTTL